MKPNELEEKAREVEATLHERMSDATRTKTTVTASQELEAISHRVQDFLSQVDQAKGDAEKREMIRMADEILLALHTHEL